MGRIEKRIAALENRQSTEPTPSCVCRRDGETFEAAAARIGITTGGYASIPEVMAVSDWCEAARLQQAALTGGTL